MKKIFSVLFSLVAIHAFSATFEIGESDFLLDGKPFKIHCGEVHYARIPRPYWRHRLQMLRAMGMNTVGCYMFWNYHEREPGKFTWTDRADAAAFCKMAQEEGLWVVLRPGPYACAEWEGGGAPAWLLKDDTISMRSSDPKWTEPAKRWITEVGRVLAPLQVTRGGPILMVQVENEYGLHGNDAAYIESLRQATVAAGFEVPLYACNPPRVIKNGFNPKLFQAANFGGDPEQRFGLVREVQPTGPMMCSEYYPAWFDTWGAKHNGPKRDKDFFGPIDWMLAHGASFSLYMAHGGTSFGGWTGCRNPFVPNVTSYDYAAPIDEQGRPNPSFFKLRDRLAQHLNPGETLGKMPEAIPVKAFGEVKLTRAASVMDFMTALTNAFPHPVYSERLDLPFGLIAWTTTVPAGVSGDLAVENIHDFGYAFLDGARLGTFDRRHRGVKLPVDAADAPRTLTIVVEAMGRINSSQGMEDRKGLSGRVTLGATELTNWTARVLPIDPDRIDSGIFTSVECLSSGHAGRVTLPAVYSGGLSVDDPADTFIDLRGFNKGIVFVNGWNLGRYWKIGPQQTLYLPGCWLKKGANTIQVVEMFEPSDAVVRSVAEPILDELHPEADFNRISRELKEFPGGTEVASGEFPNTDAAQVVLLKEPVTTAQFSLQALSSYDRDSKKPFVSIGEFDLLDEKGNPITDADLTIAGVDSEEEIKQDGVAENAIDGQVESHWFATSRALPHWIAFKAAKPVTIHGFRYTPCVKNLGRIKSWKFFCDPVVTQTVETDPAAVSRKISELFLTTEPERYKPVGYESRGYLKEGYGRGKIVQYSVVSLWANALDCARKTGNTDLEERLIRRFDDYLKGGPKHHICSRPYHVDDAIFGAVPCEIFLHTGDEKYLKMGTWYADTQWAAPSDASVKTRHNLPREEQEKLYAEGYSPQTRLWIDDMYMITALQSQAFRATGDVKYIERAAKEMCLYLDRLQLKDGPAQGLFYHAPDTPYVWGRGDGWMAAGMALVLSHLPETSPHRTRILGGYRLMMATLLKYQRADGFWCQLVDRPDDPRNWPEGSCTAMFAYAYLMGVTRGWLDAAVYEEPALRAWNALCATLDEHGNVPNTCCGTGKKNDLEYYFNRTKVDGDPHAQAPMLWCAGVLLERQAKKVTFGPKDDHPFLENHLKLGGANPDGVRIDVNSLYFTRGGRPWIPIMGELHFSRVPETEWADALHQMKLGGCNTVATYVFWNHHEEIEGEWNWSGRYDLRKFIALAKAEGLDVIIRIGPWCHGEVRNGGFPDWLLKKGIKLREEDSPEFMAHTRKLYSEIARETKGLFWKDGGPIVGVQVENEKTNRPNYLLALKRLAIKLGMDAPLFTVTGWNRKEGAMIPVDDVVPVFGGYSDAPWAGNTKRQPPSNNFFFTRARNDSGIGSDLAEMKVTAKNGWRLPYERYPYATCEIGGGLQSTHHRRYIIDPRDVYVPSLVKLGGGNNMPGYYVYKGGLNPLGKLSTLQESKATKYPNDLPIIDYDYQAPISSYGEEREHYGMLNLLHLFLQDFQSDFAPMKAREAVVRPENRDDCTTLRAAARSRNGSGFVFFSTYQRLAKLAAQTNVVFEIDGVTFPAVDIPEGVAGIFPYNLKVGDATLVAATAQLFCTDGDDYVFVEIPGVKPQFVWKNGKAGKTRLLSWEDAIRMRRENGRLVKREFRRGKTVAATLKKLESAPFAIARPEVAAELQLDGPHEVAWYEISADADGFVELPEVCDVEQLYVDGELVADYFYNGTPWRLPTKLFKDKKAHLAVAAFKGNVYREW